jgi:NAD(P)-dependent dehydrogenase (short-subunit alcohol dehydrogenase family)
VWISTVIPGGVAAVCVTDITDEAQCRAAIEQCVTRFGRVDVLHNNVGIGHGDRGPGSLSEEAFDLIMKVNLKGPWFMAKHALPVMRAQKAGGTTSVGQVA